MAEHFSGLPDVPNIDIDPSLANLLRAMKEQVELLNGTRGEIGGGSKALTNSTIGSIGTLNNIEARLSATGSGISIAGVSMPTLDDYSKLMSDVARLLTAQALTIQTLNAIITAMKGK